jgi:hypothetical protein
LVVGDARGDVVGQVDVFFGEEALGFGGEGGGEAGFREGEGWSGEGEEGMRGLELELAEGGIDTLFGNRGVLGVHVEKLDIEEPFKSCVLILDTAPMRCNSAIAKRNVCTCGPRRDPIAGREKDCLAISKCLE